MSYEAYHEHVHTRPQPIFGLAGACADRVQSGMSMRGPAGPGGEKVIEEVFRGRTTRCRYTFTAIKACMAPHPPAGGCAFGTQLNFIPACAKPLAPPL